MLTVVQTAATFARGAAFLCKHIIGQEMCRLRLPSTGVVKHHWLDTEVCERTNHCHVETLISNKHCKARSGCVFEPADCLPLET